MSVIFANKYIEDAIRKILNISEENNISACDMERIKYLRIGHLDGLYGVEISEKNPPDPFSDTDGGDEWLCALRGKQIKKFLKKAKKRLLNPYQSNGYSGKNRDASSDEAVSAWEIYKTSIISEHSQEQIEGLDEYVEQWNEKKRVVLGDKWTEEEWAEFVWQWNEEKGQEEDKLRDKWHESNMNLIGQDMPHFTGLKVLRVQGLTLPDYAIFHNMKNLKTLELVEIYFLSTDGYEKLFDLQQLSCWVD